MSAKRKPKTKMGRPPLPRGTQKAIRLSVRVTEAERAMLESEAQKQGITISDLLMQVWRDGRKGE